MSYFQMLTVSARLRTQAVILLLLMFLANTAIHAQSLPPEVSRAWDKTGLPDTSLSMVIEEVGGARLAALGSGDLKNPASVMKLLTTWSALSELGPDYVWRTAFLMDANAVVNDNGVLSGPLYLRPSGDPLFLLQDLWRLMRELRLRGINQISDIVIDRSKFGDIATNPGDFDGKGDRPYNASPDVLMVGFGAVRLVFTPDLGNKRWRAFIDPPIAGVEIDSNVRYRSGSCRSGPQVSFETITTGDQVRFRISGEATGACGEFDFYRLAFSQSDFSAKALKSMWTELGGQMTGTVKEGAIAPDAIPLAAHESPPLAEVIRVVNKSSNNVMTRVLLLTIASELGQRPATVAGGVKTVLQTLMSQGIDTDGIVIENGSGLARGSRISADQVAQMLQMAWRSPAMPEYVSSLAILGTDGTLRRRLRGDARGYAHMKTGALRDARAIAGYVLSQTGKRYVFVSLVNDPQAFKARDFENQVVDWLTSR
uniref:D-alanyl-D-alanine carboxypeptidase/D-alanyl-D-alanine endopeptidase n=2 Tax=Orrella sp. TaxID=1921583 RepID=UPI004047AACF